MDSICNITIPNILSPNCILVTVRFNVSQACDVLTGRDAECIEFETVKSAMSKASAQDNITS